MLSIVIQISSTGTAKIFVSLKFANYFSIKLFEMETIVNSFEILVPYSGKIGIAHVQQLNSLNNFVYRVKFANGFITVFNTHEPENEEQIGWSESGFGETELARHVGSAIDFYHANDVQPFTIKLDEQVYFILPKDEYDNVFYYVFQNEFICMMVLNENDQWETVTDTADAKLIKKIGDVIESICS
jgi:hypothetical protein